jgi:hypothetical protein
MKLPEKKMGRSERQLPLSSSDFTKIDKNLLL